jgi:mannose-6-phosphate isomerase-like protein (cupin superfamily)
MTRSKGALVHQDSTNEPYGLAQETPRRGITSLYARSPCAVAKLCAYWTGITLGSLLVAGCSQLPTSGPSSREIAASTTAPGAAAIQIVEVDDAVTRRLLAQRNQVNRSWGWYDGIDAGARFEVKPGASLSLQMHHHRAEHWIVVSGTAEVTNGDKVIMLTENQSTYIPIGTTHRLANPGKVPLEIIEVQSGSYLGEDDIVRFEDTYGRK